MAGLPWYAHSIESYERKTAHLTMLQHGAYRLLMDHYYKMAAPLPAKLEQLHRICRAVAEEEKAAVSAVLAEFFELAGDGWHNHRADQELAKMAELSQKRRSAAQSRSKRTANAPAIAVDLQPEMPAKEKQVRVQKHPTSNIEHISPSFHSGESAQGAPSQPKKNLGTRWPPEKTVPNDWIDHAEEQFRNLGRSPPDFAVEAVKFANYWASKSGKDAARLDWEKTWINWALSSRSAQNGNGNSAPKRPAIDQHLAGIASLIDDSRGLR